jgi:hypothetical protein
MRSTSSQRSSPSPSRSSSPPRRRWASVRKSEMSGMRSEPPNPTRTSRPSISSRNSPARWARSHGAPSNWTAWVTSWMATHAVSWVRSRLRLRAACARLGASSSRRGVGDSSSSAMSYWPSTRWESIPVTAPTWAPSSNAENERMAAANGPEPSPMRAVSGSSSGRMVAMLASIQRGRSTSSSGGRLVVTCRPV